MDHSDQGFLIRGRSVGDRWALRAVGRGVIFRRILRIDANVGEVGEVFVRLLGYLANCWGFGPHPGELLLGFSRIVGSSGIVTLHSF